MHELLISSRIRRATGKAVADFRMIEAGDRILIGLSGGKDSLLLTLALALLRRHSPVPFTLKACTVDPGNGTFDLSSLESFCASLDIPLLAVRHDIFGIIEKREERSPCSFCATMRRGLLCSAAKEAGFNLVALGHHLDDAVETVFLNLFSGGRFRCFKPKLWHSRTEITVIRPLIYLEERHIEAEAARLNLPICSPPCPYGKETQRASTKEMIQQLLPLHPALKSNVLHALTHWRPDDVWGEEEA